MIETPDAHIIGIIFLPTKIRRFDRTDSFRSPKIVYQDILRSRIPKRPPIRTSHPRAIIINAAGTWDEYLQAWI